MALDTATASPEPRRLRVLPGSRIGRLIIALNLAGLAIMIAGALILNERRNGLVEARIDSLTTQSELIANVIGGAATRGEPSPMLEADRASDILQLLFIPRSQRARLFDAQGRLLADSYLIADTVETDVLPPAHKTDQPPAATVSEGVPLPPVAAPEINPRPVKIEPELAAEIRAALQGAPVTGVRRGPGGEKVVSVSVPIQHVQAVLGVLTLEAGDVDSIIAAQRRAMLPFILLAVGATLVSSVLLSGMIAQPILRLARAADRVRLSRARSISLPSMARRQDELGDLARSLESMTSALTHRMDAIERFAADVAHEIRNPLTSIRSAVDTLPLVVDPTGRQRLLDILGNDVGRLDRLITDISNASRLDAELSRDAPRRLDLSKQLSDITSLYNASARPGEPSVLLSDSDALEPIQVMGREGPLSQVFRNLIDNARSFSAPGGQVRVSLRRGAREALVEIDDDGPGIPPDNLETIFERFYTSRPKGQAFGGNSGLGLSIARQIVEAHGGRVWAQNRSGEGAGVAGARFTVALPDAHL